MAVGRRVKGKTFSWCFGCEKQVLWTARPNENERKEKVTRYFFLVVGRIFFRLSSRGQKSFFLSCEGGEGYSKFNNNPRGFSYVKRQRMARSPPFRRIAPISNALIFFLQTRRYSYSVFPSIFYRSRSFPRRFHVVVGL